MRAGDCDAVGVSPDRHRSPNDPKRRDRLITTLVAVVGPIAVALLALLGAIATRGIARVLFAIVSALAFVLLLWDIWVLGVVRRIMSDVAKSPAPHRRRQRVLDEDDPP